MGGASTAARTFGATGAGESVPAVGGTSNAIRGAVAPGGIEGCGGTKGASGACTKLTLLTLLTEVMFVVRAGGDGTSGRCTSRRHALVNSVCLATIVSTSGKGCWARTQSLKSCLAHFAAEAARLPCGSMTSGGGGACPEHAESATSAKPMMIEFDRSTCAGLFNGLAAPYKRGTRQGRARETSGWSVLMSGSTRW
jgi:hypothetical protein